MAERNKKVRIVGCTFATPEYAPAAALLRATALDPTRGDMDAFFRYSPNDVTLQPSMQPYASARGYGLWSWKPSVILAAMEEKKDVTETVVVVYCDAAMAFASSVRPHVDALVASGKAAGLVRVGGDLQHGKYTSTECLRAMGCDTEDMRSAPQLNGAFQMYVACPKARALLREYEKLCNEPRLMRDPPPSEEDEEFVAHRHDQSVLTCLALAPHCWSNDVVVFKDPSQHGLGDSDSTRHYSWASIPSPSSKPILIHHRLCNPGS